MTVLEGWVMTLRHAPPLSQTFLKLARKVFERWREICLKSPTQFAEATLAWVILGWGVSFLMVGPPGEPMLREEMLKMAPLSVWTVTLFLVGLLKIVAVMMDHVRLRQIASLCAIWFWAFWTFVYWRVPYVMPGRFAAPVLAFASVLIFWQLAKAVKHDASTRNTGRGEISSDIDGDCGPCRLLSGNLDQAERPGKRDDDEDPRPTDRDREIIR